MCFKLNEIYTKGLVYYKQVLVHNHAQKQTKIGSQQKQDYYPVISCCSKPVSHIHCAGPVERKHGR